MNDVAAGPSATADWRRFLLLHALQLIPLAALLLIPGASGAWSGGVLGACICCFGASPRWRWRRWWLIALAGLWLVWPLSLIG